MSKEQMYDQKHNAAADVIHTWFLACLQYLGQWRYCFITQMSEGTECIITQSNDRNEPNINDNNENICQKKRESNSVYKLVAVVIRIRKQHWNGNIHYITIQFGAFNVIMCHSFVYGFTAFSLS